jgi:hypothetical protein
MIVVALDKGNTSIKSVQIGFGITEAKIPHVINKIARLNQGIMVIH